MMIGVMEITHVEKVVGVVRVELEAFGDVGEERVIKCAHWIMDEVQSVYMPPTRLMED